MTSKSFQSLLPNKSRPRSTGNGTEILQGGSPILYLLFRLVAALHHWMPLIECCYGSVLVRTNGVTPRVFYLSLPESSLDGAASNASPLNCTVVNCEGFKRLMPPTETWNVAATEHFLMSHTPHAHATLSRMLFIGSYRVQFRELATTAILLGPPRNF